MKRILLALAGLAVASTAFGASATLNCTPVAGVGTSVVVQSLFFTQGSGTGSFSCSDAALGAVTLSAVSVSIFTDYTAGNGTITDPNDNSAGFQFSNAATTWAAAQPGAFTSTMNLATTVTLFTIGNLSSQLNTFTNTTAGGIGGTQYLLPTTDAITGALLGVFSIGATGNVDAGGFVNGASDARIQATFTYTPVTTGSPEPVSMLLFGSGLLAVSLIGRKKLAGKR
jgi:hypothetical protein